MHIHLQLTSAPIVPHPDEFYDLLQEHSIINNPAAQTASVCERSLSGGTLSDFTPSFPAGGSHNVRLTHLENIDGRVLPSLIEPTSGGVNSWRRTRCKNINHMSQTQFYLTPPSPLIAGAPFEAAWPFSPRASLSVLKPV